MRALWLENQQLTFRDDVPEPETPPGEARVRVTCAGICSTDLELRRGYYPFTGVLGHEFVGVVESGGGRLDGRRVVGEINAVCHQCTACRNGRPRHCEQRTVLGIVGRHGAFAEWLTLPVENLLAVPEDLPDEVAVFTEPLAAAVEILEQIDVETGHRVAVVGAGRLGQLIARVLKGTGCDLTVLARSGSKRELLELVGIRSVPANELQPGHFDLVVECTGNPEGFRLARQAVRPRGTLVLKSTYTGDLQLDASAIVVDEITLLGSRCGPFAPALEMLARGTVDPRPLLSDTFALEDGLEAFRKADSPGVLKVMLRM